MKEEEKNEKCELKMEVDAAILSEDKTQSKSFNIEEENDKSLSNQDEAQSDWSTCSEILSKRNTPTKTDTIEREKSEPDTLHLETLCQDFNFAGL